MSRHWLALGAVMVALVAGTGELRAQPADGATVTYLTREGDTLIGLGERILIRPGDWTALQRINGIKNPRAIPVGTPLRIPVALLKTADAPGKVLAVAGDARINGAPAVVGAPVASGAQLVTGAAGAVTIALADGSQITLQPQSELQVNRAKSFAGMGVFDSLMKLLFGRVETRVNPQRQGDRFEIETSTASLAVRGTVFRVGADSDGKASTSEVLEGKIAAGSPAVSQPVLVPEGFGTRVERGQPPLPPVKLLPAPDVSALPRLQDRVLVRFSLPPVTGAASYRSQISRDKEFRDLVADQQLSSPDFRFSELADGRYFLRARAVDRLGIEGSDAVHAFSLKARPEPPLLATPAARSKVLAGAVPFAWSQPVAAGRFRLQVARDAAFRDVLIDNHSVATNQFSASIEAQGQYHWRVASITPDGDVGPFGDAQMFDVRPATATLPAPAETADGLGFSLTAEPGQTLHFQVARDGDFRNIVSEQTFASPNVTLAKPGAGEYFIRYRTVDADGFTGPYSAAQRVTIYGQPWYLLLFLAPLLL